MKKLREWTEYFGLFKNQRRLFRSFPVSYVKGLQFQPHHSRKKKQNSFASISESYRSVHKDYHVGTSEAKKLNLREMILEICPTPVAPVNRSYRTGNFLPQRQKFEIQLETTVVIKQDRKMFRRNNRLLVKINEAIRWKHEVLLELQNWAHKREKVNQSTGEQVSYSLKPALFDECNLIHQTSCVDKPLHLHCVHVFSN